MNCPYCNGEFKIAGGMALKPEDEIIVRDFISLSKDAQQLILNLVARLKNG